MNSINDQKAKTLYKSILKYMINIQNQMKEVTKLDFDNVIPIAKEVVDFMEVSKALNFYAVNYYDTEDIFLSHSANVTIFAVTLGMGLKYPKDELINLCSAAIIHDIGINRIPKDLVNKSPKELSEKEIIYFQKHSEFGFDSINRNDEFSSYLAEMILQHHEKNNGEGYPNKLKTNEIHPHAMIISLIDSFESLIHPRDHRDIWAPPVGIQQILHNQGDYYDKTILRALLNFISIYPVGMFVKLSSNEIAQIVEINPKNPMRPAIKIQYDSKGKKIEPKLVHLMDEPLMRIDKCIPMKHK